MTNPLLKDPKFYTEDPLVFLLCDAYKTGHINQQPLGTDSFFENLTARSHTYFNTPLDFDGSVFMGLQRLVLRWLVGSFDNFFKTPFNQVEAEYLEYMDGVLGKGVVKSTHLKELHELGYIPLEIRAVPEGSLVPIRVPFLTIENTVDGFGWLTGYFEDLWSNELWKPCVLATKALHFRRVLEQYANETGAAQAFIDYQAHNFALRGMSGMFDDANSSVGQLIYFKGSDSFPSVWTANRFYNPEGDVSVSEIAGSVPATEHSVTCLNIAVYAEELKATPEYANVTEAELLSKAEELFQRRLITEVYPSGVFSFVSDTNDFFDTITTKAIANKDAIMARDGKLVYRPDSGNPYHILCGYTWDGDNHNSQEMVVLGGASALDATKFVAIQNATSGNFESFCVDGQFYSTKTGKPISIEEQKGAVQILWEIFGGTTNAAGYKELDPHVGLIYGDAININTMTRILSRLKENGFCSSNVVFGVGSFEFQFVTRDTLGIAMKATAGKVNGKHYNIAKNPKTDDGTKKSAKGYLIVYREDDGTLTLKDDLTREQYETLRGSERDAMRTVYLNGDVKILESIRTIRERAAQWI
ncbi:nicotinamide phosphoribosyl transferase [Klebsiella phage vB_KpM_FBKp24]|uniref:Nicotinamide phosphoribosyltransferase n=1 Tax=Klebsiella phage vB_KpM_FBKp24 TaxID=2801834 RepID=A0A7U0J5C1_9CAUD|nr:nicotinamide phosphoribosyl transferase [Klebsiella phage vB_KpM_FBKp24]QQV92024.1 nicotinamide phosphoribosyltransferase [Klebsiella phage vB_KpM_FBKp24]